MIKKIFLCLCLVSNLKSVSQEYILETVVQKERAVLDLTIKKISSKGITGIIDRIGKIVLLEINENNQIYITENLDELSYVSVSGKNNNYNKVVNYNNELLNGKEIKNGNLSYRLQNFNGKKIISLVYQIEPTDLYIGIIQKNGDLDKVYKVEFVEDIDQKFEYLGLTVETPEPLDFRKSLLSQKKGSVVAASTQIVVKNPNGLKLELKTKTPQVELKNGESTLTVDNFNIEEKKEIGKNVFILTGKMDDLPLDIPSGQYKGTVYLELYSQ
ncbi:MAG: hypothetical protein ACRC8M_08655 [Cetobacterium sp.]|uniref:hypothetical protein n=1 Tax=Cetobacterium sp. TaxID=2071632 RepID=UPI003F3C3C51